MNIEHPERLIVIAIILLVFGFVVPFLMALKVVESTFFLNFFSFGASVLGLFLGMVGIALYRGRRKKKEDDEDSYK